MLLPWLMLLSLAPHGDPSPKKGYYALADMVDDADLICIGRVEELLEVLAPAPMDCGWFPQRRELTIARVAVERVLEGPNEVTVVYHEAWPTWTCDSTRAEVGERALFLLSRSGKVAQAPEDVRDAVHASIGSTLLFRNLGSGDGIQRITEADGEELVWSSGAPGALESAGRRTRLADVSRYVEELLRFSPDSLDVHARSGWASLYKASSFDLRILPSGETRLATWLGPAEQVQTFELDPLAWRGLRDELVLLVGGAQRVAGVPAEHFPARELSIRVGGGALDFVEPMEWPSLAELTPVERRDLRDALDAWTRVRAVIDCPDCPTHAEESRRLLESLR